MAFYISPPSSHPQPPADSAFEQFHQAPVLTLALDRDGGTLATTTRLVAQLGLEH